MRSSRLCAGSRGIEDLGVFRVLGQPNLNVTVDRRQAARYQINVADVQDAIQTAVGGNALTQVLQGEARYDLVMRYLPQYRNTKEAIENIRLLSPTGERVSLAQLCTIEERDGASEVYREANQRYIAVKYSVRDRDLGSAVEEAMRKVTQGGPTAAGLSHQLGGRIRERATRQSAPVHHRAADGSADLHHSVHHVPLLQMGHADSGQCDGRAHRRLAGARWPRTPTSASPRGSGFWRYSGSRSKPG